MEHKLFGFRITIEKEREELYGAKIGWWYRFEGDPTDKVRLLYKGGARNPIRCIKCEKEIRVGYVWDLYFVTVGLFNYKFDRIACTKCFPHLDDVLKHYRTI
jgi:hypothetical protein